VDRVEPRIVLSPRQDATPDSSRTAIARCYAYLVERRRLRSKKEAAEPGQLSGRDDVKESNGYVATENSTAP
jgi:hypothetical protein